MIRLGSTFHSMHAISSTFTPASMQDNSSQLGSPVLEGICELVAETFSVKCLQTLTGVKFILSSNEHHSISQQDSLLHRVYEAYADFVSKNPFQEDDMPIKSELFDNQINSIFNL